MNYYKKSSIRELKTFLKKLKEFEHLVQNNSDVYSNESLKKESDSFAELLDKLQRAYELPGKHISLLDYHYLDFSSNTGVFGYSISSRLDYLIEHTINFIDCLKNNNPIVKGDFEINHTYEIENSENVQTTFYTTLNSQIKLSKNKLIKFYRIKEETLDDVDMSFYICYILTYLEKSKKEKNWQNEQFFFITGKIDYLYNFEDVKTKIQEIEQFIEILQKNKVKVYPIKNLKTFEDLIARIQSDEGIIHYSYTTRGSEDYIEEW
ncbi:MAG: hypothetical protein ACTSQF_15445 [Candidatus Heimdallarchaeaceae archaeon]